MLRDQLPGTIGLAPTYDDRVRLRAGTDHGAETGVDLRVVDKALICVTAPDALDLVELNYLTDHPRHLDWAVLVPVGDVATVHRLTPDGSRIWNLTGTEGVNP